MMLTTFRYETAMKPVFLILTTMFPEEGSHRYPFVYDHAKAIQRDGQYEVIVLKAVKFSDPVGKINYRGIPVVRFHQVMNVSSLFLPVNLFKLKSALVQACIRPESISVCQIHGWGSLLGNSLFLKKLNPKMRIVRHYDDFDPLIFSRSRYYKIPVLSKYWKKLVIHQTTQLDLHVGVSDRTIECLEKIPGVALKNKYTLHNGVDCQKFYPVAEKKLRDQFYIGCVGNFIPLKDQMTLLRAAERLLAQGMEDLRLKFIGSGPTRVACQNYVKTHPKLSSHVEFLTEVDHRELNQFYNSLDLFVLPSYYEAFGCVYLEAYACGVPFMACRGQGIEEFIPEEEKGRWLIPPHDDGALARQIQNFREHGFTQRLNYPIDIDWHVGRYLSFLKELDG